MKKIAILLFSAIAMALSSTNIMAINGYVTNVTNICGTAPFDTLVGATSDCELCHTSGQGSQYSDPTLEKTAFSSQGACYFCPTEPACQGTTPPTTPVATTEAELLQAAQNTTRAYMENLFALFIGHVKAEGQNAVPPKVSATGAILNPSVFADVFYACPQIAPVAASNFSKDTGYLVRRVSTRTRNSRNIPDEWELAQLLKFEMMAADQNPRVTFDITKPDGTLMHPKEFEAYDVVTEGTGQNLRYYFRYMRSLTMPPHPKDATAVPNPGLPCLFCHGTDGATVTTSGGAVIPELAPGVLDQAALFYPHDQALGYSKGDIRGAWTVKIPLAAAPDQPNGNQDMDDDDDEDKHEHRNRNRNRDRDGDRNRKHDD